MNKCSSILFELLVLVNPFTARQELSVVLKKLITREGIFMLKEAESFENKRIICMVKPCSNM
jgi:hypothetical protein